MWVTEVKQPWLEIHDVPYSSYMYLGTADYRWDVAAIDAAGQTGPLSTRSFSVTPQLFMKQESFVRF